MDCHKIRGLQWLKVDPRTFSIAPPCGFQGNLSTHIVLIVMKFGSDIVVQLRMNCNNFSDHFAFQQYQSKTVDMVKIIPDKHQYVAQSTAVSRYSLKEPLKRL